MHKNVIYGDLGLLGVLFGVPNFAFADGEIGKSGFCLNFFELSQLFALRNVQNDQKVEFNLTSQIELDFRVGMSSSFNFIR